MSQHHTWVVPYFNGELRLNKPPLSYWVTELLVETTGGHYSEIYDRLPSALAAVALVALTIWMGKQLFCASVGLYSGMILATTLGFVRFSHDGRPDMLYAALCTAMIPLLIQAWRTKSKWTRMGSAYGMWICFGLATLDKGPHIPAAILLGFLLVLMRHPGSRRPSWSILRPFVGSLIAVAIALPWWLLLHERIGEALAESQLAGNRYQLSWLAVFNPYYFYRSLPMMLPWVILLPATIGAFFEKGTRAFHVRSLGIIIGVTAIMLSFGEGRRAHYMLPMLAPWCVLMGRVAYQYWSVPGQETPQKRKNQTTWLWGHLLICAGILGVHWVLRRETLSPFNQMTLGMAIATMFIMPSLIGRAWPPSPPKADHGKRVFLAMALGFAIFFSAIQSTGIMSERFRWSRKEMGLRIKEHATADDEVIAYKVNSRELIYYSDHMIRSAEEINELRDDFKNTSAKKIYVVTNKEDVLALMKWGAGEVLAEVDACDDGQPWLLLVFSHNEGALH